MYKVTTAFKDAANNMKIYNAGDIYAGADQERIDHLIQQGFITAEAENQNQAAQNSEAAQSNFAADQTNQAQEATLQAKTTETKTTTQAKTTQAKGNKAKEAGE